MDSNIEIVSSNIKVKPSKKQLEFLSWEFGVFFHFGIRTFYEGHRDFDYKPMPLKGFNPLELDCEQWISTIKEAGAKYAIFVAKHHDGFANWPSKYTSYSVANTPWREGRGDVVAEFIAACRKHDIKVGIYYSPADFEMKNRTGAEHDDYFINQISELLTGYGKIDYLWFDGAGSENHKYDSVRIINVIRNLQPDIIIFNMWDPDTRWIGNEAGLAPYPFYNVVKSVDFSIYANEKERIEAKCFLPGECDFRMRLDNWFYSDHDEDTVKSLDELIGLYYYSVGRGTNFLINIGPDRRGLVPKADSERIIELGKDIKRRFSNPIATKKDFIKDGDKYICKLEKPVLINHLIAGEALEKGQNVDEFEIRIKPYPYGEHIPVFYGKTIGNKVICSFPSVMTSEIIFVVTKSSGNVATNKLDVYYVKP